MHLAVGRAPAVVRLTRLQTTIRGPDDAWGRAGRPQQMLVSADVSLRAGRVGAASARRDALASDTVHYGRLAKAVVGAVEAIVDGRSGRADEQPLPLRDVLARLWLCLAGRFPWQSSPPRDAAPGPLIDAAAVSCLELTAHLPKASRLGDGVSLVLTGVFPPGTGAGTPVMYGLTLRLHGLRVPTLVGVNDNERRSRQAVVVSVEVDNFVAPIDTHCALEALVVDVRWPSSLRV